MKAKFATSHIFLAVIFLGIFAMAAHNAEDPDLWWHLKAGQYIAEHNSVPHADPFSYTRAGQTWVAHEWLTEVLLYEVERRAGFGGLIFLFALVISIAFFLLCERCGRSPYNAGLATLFAAIASRPLWGIRPQMLSLLLTSVWLLILERSERDPKLLWWTLPLTLFWANLHAGFALGLALSALILAGEWIEQAPSARNYSHLRTAALVFLLDLLIVPLNPNGTRLFWYPFETLRSAAMQKYIAEWASPNFHHPEYWPFLMMIVVVVAVLCWSSVAVRRRDMLLLIISLYAALCSIRMIPLFALIAAPIIARGVATWPVPAWHKFHQVPTARSMINATILLVMAAFASVHIVQVIQRQPTAERELFPSGAASFLEAHPSTGQIFNHYDWGGYLIWKLYPSTRVFIDGRADLYGQQLFDQFADTYQFRGRWQNAIEEWDISTVIIPPTSPLATGLRVSQDWIVSYEDRQAVIFSALHDRGR